MGYWGRHFPDRYAPSYTTPARHARLALSSVTSGEGPVNAVVQAAGDGYDGNNITFSMVGDATDAEGTIDGTSTAIVVHFLPDSTTMEMLNDLFESISGTRSALNVIELKGFWDREQVLVAGDAFAATNLSGGVPAGIGGRTSYWGNHFGERRTQPNVVYSGGPQGVATFAVALESGLVVTLSWNNAVFKAYDGSENRAANLTCPSIKIEGEVILIGDMRATSRAKLHRYAAMGQPFDIGMTHEGVSLLEESDTTVMVPSRTDLEWMNPGQKVMIQGLEDNKFNVNTIQQVVDGTIILNSAPGADVAKRTATLMPVLPILLDPQQKFDRYAVEAEAWTLSGQSMTFGWRKPAALHLGSQAVSGNLDGIYLTTRIPGDFANSLLITISQDITLHMTETNVNLQAWFVPGVTTAGDLVALLSTSQLYQVVTASPYNPATVLQVGDSFAATAVAGGDTLDTGQNTSTIAEFEDHPVWDREIHLQDGESALESLAALSEIIDFGGVPGSGGELLEPEWGRQVSICKTDPDEWLWLRGFLREVRGQQRAFWLPSFREDLRATQPFSGTTLTIDASFGDFIGWFPNRRALQVRQGDNLYWLWIDSYTQDASEFILTVHGDDLPDDAEIDEIGWLELCRFNNPTFEIVFEGHKFSMLTSAHVVRQ